MEKIFDRWKSCYDETLLLRQFRAHHTELNSMYWCYRSGLGLIGKRLRPYADNERPDAAGLLLSGEDARRVPPTLGHWRANSSELSNWIRLAAIMSISAYFEIYLTSATRMALASAPASPLGSIRAVDGYLLDANRSLEAWSDDLRSVTNGAWDARFMALKRLFGPLPKSLLDRTADLDASRRLRNAVGHSFGRDKTARQPNRETGATRVSERSLKKTLALFHETAEQIDRFLAPAIGSYELLQVADDAAASGASRTDRERQFRKYLGQKYQVGWVRIDRGGVKSHEFQAIVEFG